MTTPAAAPPALPKPSPADPKERIDPVLRDEYDSGLDQTGPRYESEEDEGCEP